jgi:hypothetical protein
MRIALEPNAAQSEPRKRAFIYRALEIVQVQPPRFLEADRRRSRTSPPRSALTLRLLLRVTRVVAADPQCVGAAQSTDGGHSCLWPFSTTAMVATAEDQHSVEAVGAQRAYQALGVGVRVRLLDRRTDPVLLHHG